MNVFKFADRDLTPLVVAALAFVAIGAAAVLGLAALAEPGFSLSSLLP